MGANFKINKAALKKIEQDVQKRVSGVQVPLSGSEADAIRSVKHQLKKMGATPNDAKVAQMVRDVRNSQSD